jgi:hypothetical protein
MREAQMNGVEMISAPWNKANNAADQSDQADK